MKIVFYPQSCVPYNANTLDERPIGGVETGIIRLSFAMRARGHQVVVFTPDKNPPKSDPPFVPIAAAQQMGPVDVFIVIREWIPLVYNLPAKKKFFWTGDAFDQVHSFGIGDKRVAEIIDGALLISDWHADSLCKASGFPREKAYVIRNGVHLPYFEGSEERVRKRLIYSSTPFRGLQFLPSIYAELKKKHPDMEMHVFSAYKVYEGPRGYDARLEQQYEQLKQELQRLPDVYVHGNVLQKELAREFMKSSILAYPNTFAETGCITAMEAQAAGCAIVSTDLAALKETVGDAGVLISGEAGTPEYNKEFIEVTDRMLSDDEYWKGFSEAGRERAKTLGWDEVARRFEEYLKTEHGLS